MNIKIMYGNIVVVGVDIISVGKWDANKNSKIIKSEMEKAISCMMFGIG